MVEQEVVDYILQAQKHGLADFEIKQNLLNAGWEAQVVEDSLVSARALENKTPVSFASAVKTAAGSALPAGPIEKALPPASLNSSPIHEPAAVKPNPVLHQAETAAPASLNDEHFENPAATGKSFFRKPLFWIALAVLLLLAGGAGAYYTLVYSNPTKIWEKFTKNNPNLVYQTKFNITYSDLNELSNSSSSELSFLSLKDIKVALEGNGYLNGANTLSPVSNSSIQYTFSSGNTSFSTGVKYILLNNVLYLNVGDNPLLDLISQEANNGQKIDWIKIDLTALKNQSDQSADAAKAWQQISSPDFKSALEKIWENATIVKEDKYLGHQTINGVTTLHFQNSIDKQALKALVSQYVQQISKTLQGSGSELKTDDAATINKIAGELIDKIQVKEFDTYIGLTDAKLYRVHLVANAPSFISLVENSQNLSLPQSNDSKRLSDISEVEDALGLYKNDNGGFPDAKDGQPLGLAPDYIGAIPVAPAPDGTCTDYYNSYWYQPTGAKKDNSGKVVYDSYQMTFCLGSDTGGYKAGIAELSPEGIKSNIACPTTPDQCVNPAGATDQNAQIKKEATDLISKLNFNAEVSADVDYSDYGKSMSVTAPTSTFDVLQTFQDSQAKSDDAKRLADVRAMASSLELYFNDNNSYPDNLQQLTPTYISTVPSAPSTNLGSCSESDNNYTYTKKSATEYNLTFCLGQDTGGYSAGKHTLSPNGIE